MSTDTGTREPARSTETPFRYGAALAEQIEQRWQDRWEREGTFAAPDPGEPGSEREKVYLLDMFPYPSGAGLHVGHPLGFIGRRYTGKLPRSERPSAVTSSLASTVPRPGHQLTGTSAR